MRNRSASWQTGDNCQHWYPGRLPVTQFVLAFMWTAFLCTEEHMCDHVYFSSCLTVCVLLYVMTNLLKGISMCVGCGCFNNAPRICSHYYVPSQHMVCSLLSNLNNSFYMCRYICRFFVVAHLVFFLSHRIYGAHSSAHSRETRRTNDLMFIQSASTKF
jgi:hypothetical protein